METINQNRISNYMGPERRQFKRIKKRFMARFRLKEAEGVGQSSTGWDVVSMQNLGAGGVLFNYNRQIEVGKSVDLKINFPASRTSIDCVAKVARVEEPPHFPIYHIAAVFTEISEQGKELINRAAEEFFAKKPGQIEA